MSLVSNVNDDVKVTILLQQQDTAVSELQEIETEEMAFDLVHFLRLAKKLEEASANNSPADGGIGGVTQEVGPEHGAKKC